MLEIQGYLYGVDIKSPDLSPNSSRTDSDINSPERISFTWHWRHNSPISKEVDLNSVSANINGAILVS